MANPRTEYYQHPGVSLNCMDKNRIAQVRKSVHNAFGPLPVPEQSYLVLMSARCGSNLLCSHLAQIRFGKPIEAFHFNHQMMRDRHHWDIDFNDPAAYLRQAIHFQMVDGVYGMKVHWGQFQTFLKTARQLTDPFEPTITDTELIEVFFPGSAYIHIKRRDKIKQAISFSIAMQTGIWLVRTDQDDEYEKFILPSVYDREHIEGCLEELLAYDVAWENFLKRNDVNYLELWYEDLAGDFKNKMLQVYDHLGIKLVSPPDPLLRKQANRISLDWNQRFLDSTPWIREPVIAEALKNADSYTAFFHRTMMLMRQKEQARWRRMPINRFKGLKKLIFRIKRKSLSIINPGGQETTESD